jgi:hypothetical protein
MCQTIWWSPDLPGGEFASAGADSPSVIAPFHPVTGRIGAKKGSCSRLVRRTIGRRIGIQEMSGQQVFDAIMGVITISSFSIIY